MLFLEYVKAGHLGSINGCLRNLLIGSIVGFKRHYVGAFMSGLEEEIALEI